MSFATACNKSVQKNNIDNKPEIIKTKYEQAIKRLTFKNIDEIIADGSASLWVEKQDSAFSVALHFQYKDTLAITYSPECWLMFPYKLDGDKLVVYWDNNIDSKYDFDIVKAANNIDEKNIGKPFMILELQNDTTFKATYPVKELIEKINNSNYRDKERTFFPNKFNLVQDGEMYD
jgi:hypothetical protein